MPYILLGRSLAYSTKSYDFEPDESHKGDKPELKEGEEGEKSVSECSYLFVTTM